jgi:hypothetical protein
MYRRYAIRVLLVAIIFVLFKIYFKVNNCITSGGNWNAKKDLCEAKILIPTEKKKN